MRKNLPTLFLTLGLALGVARPGLAADPRPSLVQTTPGSASWTVSIEKTSKGKCKIFDHFPEYDRSGDLLDKNLKVAELKLGTKVTSCSLSQGTSYYFLFYPDLGNIKVSLKFSEPNGSEGILKVDQINVLSKLKTTPTIDLKFKGDPMSDPTGTMRLDRTVFDKAEPASGLGRRPKAFLLLD